MARGKIHVVPYGGSWAIRREGSDRVSKIAATKSEAKEIARKMAGESGEVIMHDKGGKFTKGKTYGKDPDEGNCFITTACIKHHNLPDDCYQLSTLRNFRDSYMQNSLEGKALIKQYYLIAPQIVLLLNNHSNKNKFYSDIFHEINSACSLIDEHKFSAAKKLYMKIVIQLIDYFGLNGS